MAEETVEFAFNQGRTAAVARTLHCFSGGGMHGEEIMPVDGYSRHAEARGATGNVLARNRERGGGCFRVAVVFGNEHTRQFPHRGEIQRFERRSLIRGAVAEERERDPAFAFHLGR